LGATKAKITAAGSALAGPFRSWRNRKARRDGPHLAAGAVADPLGKFWSDLDWLVADGPDVVHALDDLGEIVDVVMDEEHRPIAIAIDVEALLEEVRLRSRSADEWRPVAPETGPFDPLRHYLEDLGAREAPTALPLHR
jgi:hypothetical protein